MHYKWHKLYLQKNISAFGPLPALLVIITEEEANNLFLYAFPRTQYGSTKHHVPVPLNSF